MNETREESHLELTVAQLRVAERSVGGCEECDPRADTPFYWILDSTVGAVGRSYKLPSPATCPSCSAPILTDSLVRWS